MSGGSSLDGIDMQLLRLLQADASTSVGDLAQRVGLSQSPCWRRIQRLRDEGYILGEVALLDAARLGLASAVYVEVELGPMTPDQQAAFEHGVQATPEIVECHGLVGAASVMIKLVASDMRSCWEVVNGSILPLAGVRSVRSSAVAFTYKQTTALPLRGR